MPNTINEQIADSVSYDNVKTVAGQGAWALAALQNQFVGHSRFMDGLREKLMSDVITGKISIPEAVGAGELLADSSSSSILDKTAQLGATQQAQKTANTTPPETGLNLPQIAAQLASVLAYLEAQATKKA